MSLKRTEFKGMGVGKNLIKNFGSANASPLFNRADMQFPGKGNLFPADKPIEEIRDFIKNQKRVKGFNFDVATGTTSFALDISGEAKLMLGLSLLSLENFEDPANQPRTFTMTINNEIVINQLNPAFLSPLFMDEEYYQFLRPLSGQDDISVTFTNPNPANTMVLAFYYL